MNIIDRNATDIFDRNLRYPPQTSGNAGRWIILGKSFLPVVSRHILSARPDT